MWVDDEKQTLSESSEMIDVTFRIQCKILPYDHAYQLSSQILQYLPWLENSKNSGIQSLHGPESGNGWVRPEDEDIFLSKRTRLVLRVPRTERDKTSELEGKELTVHGNKIVVGSSNIKPFLVVPDLICRFVICNSNCDENSFLQDVSEQLIKHGINLKKAICGKTKKIYLKDKLTDVRSLMIADLKKEDSIKLQDIGVGTGRLYGCGIFLPHKSLDAVANFKED